MIAECRKETKTHPKAIYRKTADNRLMPIIGAFLVFMLIVCV